MTRYNPGTIDSRKIEAAKKRADALALRKTGMTYREIAEQVGYKNRHICCRNVRAELRRIPKEEAAELRQLEMERLDALTEAVWKIAMDGDLKAVETALKLMERRSRMLGLDSPHKISHGAEEGISMIGELMFAIRGAETEEEGVIDDTEGGDIEDDDDPEDGGEGELDEEPVEGSDPLDREL